MNKVFNLKLDIPKDLIAQKPAKPRDRARLLVYIRSTDQVHDDYFYNLEKYLVSDTTLVLNDTAVDKCRLKFGNSEIFILKKLSSRDCKALIRPGRKFKIGSIFKYQDIEFVIIGVGSDGSRILKCNYPLDSNKLDKFRHTPFPPYISANEKLAGEYQTVYAGPRGSLAAPTAGLHFTPSQLNQLKKSHNIAKLTLHVGLGTFMTPSSEQLRAKKLHEERIILSEQAAVILNRASHITAVGTTSLRALETVKKPFMPFDGDTDLFIMPGYKFSACDSLITNFHLPGSSLLMLVAAFVGSERKALKLYEHAIAEQYRFYSFGDAMIII